MAIDIIVAIIILYLMFKKGVYVSESVSVL